MSALDVSVVIASRNRPESLRRCLQAIADQHTDQSFEVVVVDDGSDPPLRRGAFVFPSLELRLVRGAGNGPGAARNLGVAAAAAPVVCFTDDDTIPATTWLDSAVTFLSEHATHAGVEGPTTSPWFDPLYAYSVESVEPFGFLTCNIAYRRATLEAIGGFDEGFPFAHNEDLDLGFRVLMNAPIGFTDGMRVAHPPRAVSAQQLIRRGRWVTSTVRLVRRHPDLYRGSARFGSIPYVAGVVVRDWGGVVRHDRYAVRRTPRRAFRLAVIAAGQITVALGTLAGLAVAERSRRGS